MKCDHIIGEWQGCYEGGVLRLSDWYADSDVERFKFCPECGKNISKLKPNRRKKEKIQHGPITEAFIKESERFGAEMMRNLLSKPPLIRLLREGTFAREISVKEDPFQTEETTPPKEEAQPGQ